MELGRLQLPVAATYAGDSDASHVAAHNAFYLLQRDLARSPGEATFVASVTVVKGQAVNLNNGELRLADASLSRPAIGIALSGATAGNKARVMLVAGYVQGLAGLTANSLVYLGNAGALLFTRPVSGLVQSLGFALSTTEMFVLVSSDLATIGGGGGATLEVATVTVPFATTDHLATVVDAAVTPTTKIALSPGVYPQTGENSGSDISFAVEAIATGSFDVRIVAPRPVGGSFNFVYLRG